MHDRARSYLKRLHSILREPWLIPSILAFFALLLASGSLIAAFRCYFKFTMPSGFNCLSHSWLELLMSFLAVCASVYLFGVVVWSLTKSKSQSISKSD